MKILVACPDFSSLSGGPMFVYELSRELVSRGHEVTVAAHAVGGLIAEKANQTGVSVLGMDKTDASDKFDVLHVQGMGPSHWAVHRFGAPAVATIHSQLVYEVPLLHDRIRHYVAVRPQIKQTIVDRDGVLPEKCSVVYNGIDLNRFRPSTEKYETPTVLFAGTVDYLRAQATHRTWEIAEENGWDVLFVGRTMSGQLDNAPSFVSHIEGDVWDIQDIVARCVATSGILLGRTLLEGWACGIPGYVFEINTEGVVQSFGVHQPPHPQLMAMFDIKHMTDCYERLYERVQ